MAEGEGFKSPFSDESARDDCEVDPGRGLEIHVRQVEAAIEKCKYFKSSEGNRARIFFHSITWSKHCPESLRDPYYLMWYKTMDEVLEIKASIDIRDAFELAHHKDEEIRQRIEDAKSRSRR